MQDSILVEALELTTGDRQADYGSPLDNWQLIADLCAPILGVRVTAEQMVLCMVQVKVARELHKPKRDNRTDIAGYADVLDKINNERSGA